MNPKNPIVPTLPAREPSPIERSEATLPAVRCRVQASSGFDCHGRAGFVATANQRNEFHLNHLRHTLGSRPGGVSERVSRVTWRRGRIIIRPDGTAGPG